MYCKQVNIRELLPNSGMALSLVVTQKPVNPLKQQYYWNAIVSMTRSKDQESKLLGSKRIRLGINGMLIEKDTGVRKLNIQGNAGHFIRVLCKPPISSVLCVAEAINLYRNYLHLYTFLQKMWIC